VKKVERFIREWGLLTVLLAAATLYSFLMITTPTTLKAAGTPTSHSHNTEIAITLICLIWMAGIASFCLIFLHSPLPNKPKQESPTKREKLGAKVVVISMIILTLITPSLLAVSYDYYDDGKIWRETRTLEINYPSKGGKYDSLYSFTIKLEDGTTVNFYPVPEKEIEVLNLIGKDGSKGSPAFVERQTNNDDFEKFYASFNQAGLGRYFHGEATIKF